MYFKLWGPLQQKMSMAFQVIQTLLAAEEAKGVGGEKERMLMVRGSKTILERYSVELGPWFWFDTKGNTIFFSVPRLS